MVTLCLLCAIESPFKIETIKKLKSLFAAYFFFKTGLMDYFHSGYFGSRDMGVITLCIGFTIPGYSFCKFAHTFSPSPPAPGTGIFSLNSTDAAAGGGCEFLTGGF